MLLSVVIPVYNEGEPLKELYQRIKTTLDDKNIAFEVIMVDDRSLDNSWDVLKEISSINKKVKIARLARNFGQHNAIAAGIQLAMGDYIVLMDCDQQDEPENIPLLLDELISKDINLVYAHREYDGDLFYKKLSSRLLHFVMRKLSGLNYDSRIGTFRIFTKVVQHAYLSMPEKKRFTGGIFYWMGFESSFVKVKLNSRQHGESNYTLKKQLSLARLSILSSSTKLLSLCVYFGIILSSTSFLIGIYFVVLKIFNNVPLGYTSIIVSIYFSSGIIMLFLGIIGEYLRELYDEIKARPIYIIEEKLNF